LLNAIQVRFRFIYPLTLLLTGLQHQNIGALAGYPFAPYMSDAIGRRPTVFFGALIMCIATAVQTASQSVGMFIGAR
jgi:MFS family permease